MMNTPPDEQARALAAWLDGPADAPPPTELDGEVAEAIGVFHPDRVPAPELDLDALLDSLSAGPLAAERGHVVAFPTRPRWGRWVTGGGSLLAMAAATLLMVRTVGAPELTDAAMLAKEEAPAQPSVAEGAGRRKGEAAKKATAREELADGRTEAKEDATGLGGLLVADADAPAPPPPPMARPARGAPPLSEPVAAAPAKPSAAPAPASPPPAATAPADYAQQRQASDGGAAPSFADDAVAEAEAPVAVATSSRAAPMPANPLRKLHQLADQRSYPAFHRLAKQTLAAGHLTQPQLIELLELQGDVYDAEGRTAEAQAARAQATALR